MMNMTLSITLEAFNQKHGEFYLQLSSLAKQYGITINNGSSVPTVSAPTTSAPTVKPDYTSHLKLEYIGEGYFKLPLRKKFVMIKATQLLTEKGVKIDDTTYKCCKTDDYRYYIADANGNVDVEATEDFLAELMNDKGEYVLEVK